MKTCTMNEFINELKPWLDRDHIRKAQIDGDGKFIVHFLDGMKNVYHVDDCSRDQLLAVLKDIKTKGIPVEE